MGDPFLNYFALGLLIFVVVVVFYGIIAIHDVPYLIAKSPKSSARGRHPCRRMGQFVHAPRAMAVFMDLGDGVSAGARMGIF